MFSIFWFLIVFLVPILVVIGVIVLFSRVNKLQSDVSILKQILYKQGNSQPVVQQPVAQPLHPAPQQAPSTFQQEVANSRQGSLTEEAGGRWLGKLGVLAIILGVSFFLKDAFENNWIGPGGRVLLGVIGGVILLVVGQMIRAKYKNYSDLLVGGSYGIFYLTTFGAFYFYHLITAPVAYGFFIGITALSVIMSVVDKSSLLASIGVVGGFLAPLLLTGLTPKSVGALAQILSYILILNIGVAVVSYVYKWKMLSFIAFVGTIFTYLVTVDYYFKPEMRLVAFVFITLYFLIFLFVSIAHHLTRGERSTSADIFLISLNALQYGVLGAAIIEKIAPDFLGFFCLAVALVYFVTTMTAWKKMKDDSLLNFYLPGIATVFLTVAIPAQFDGESVLVAWLIESLIVVWVAHKTTIKNLMYGGFGIFLVAMIKFISDFEDNYQINRRLGMYGEEIKKIDDYNIIFNEKMLYAILVSVVGGFVIWSLHLAWKKWGAGACGVCAGILFVITNIFLLTNILGEVQTAYRVAIHNQKVGVVEKKFAEQGYRDVQNSIGGDFGLTEEGAKEVVKSEYYHSYNFDFDFSAQENQKEMVNSIIMALYAIILLIAGFSGNSRFVRICGLVLIFITALYIFFSIWDLGSVYRIITALIFGIIALLGSFGYARFSRIANSQNN